METTLIKMPTKEEEKFKSTEFCLKCKGSGYVHGHKTLSDGTVIEGVKHTRLPEGGVILEVCQDCSFTVI